MFTSPLATNVSTASPPQVRDKRFYSAADEILESSREICTQMRPQKCRMEGPLRDTPIVVPKAEDTTSSKQPMESSKTIL